MAMGGNVFEWKETEFDLVNDSDSSDRGFRGGHWNSLFSNLLASARGSSGPSHGGDFGFRVASVPEPSPLLFGTVVMLGILCWKWLVG
jgi:hypothetical protein